MKYSSLHIVFTKKEGLVKEKQRRFNFIRQLFIIQTLTGILLMQFHSIFTVFSRWAKKQSLTDIISAVAVQN